MHDKDLKALLAYLKENAPRYPVDALRAQMVKAGHSPAEAEEAIAVFQGRLRPPEGPAWPLAVGVALFDFLLAWLLVTLFQRLGTGKVSCGAAALLPLVYLGQIVAGVTALAAGRDRQARALLLGILLFFGLVLVILAGFAGKWLSNHSS
ncbi:MAG: hypothetical protein ACJ76N_09700 [Thermoanaerobaculia bacterium]